MPKYTLDDIKNIVRTSDEEEDEKKSSSKYTLDDIKAIGTQGSDTRRSYGNFATKAAYERAMQARESRASSAREAYSKYSQEMDALANEGVSRFDTTARTNEEIMGRGTARANAMNTAKRLAGDINETKRDYEGANERLGKLDKETQDELYKGVKAANGFHPFTNSQKIFENLQKKNGWTDDELLGYVNDAYSQYDRATQTGTLAPGEALEYASAKIAELPVEEQSVVKSMIPVIKGGSEKGIRGVNGKSKLSDLQVGDTVQTQMEQLRKMGWSEAKIEEYRQYASRIANAEATDEFNKDLAIDENSSFFDKVSNTAYALNPSRVIAGGVVSTLNNGSNYGLGRDMNDPTSAMQKSAEYAQNQVANSIDSDAGRFLYGVGTSIGQSAEVMLAGAALGFTGVPEGIAKVGSLLPFSANVYNTSYESGKERKASNAQAQYYGIAAGAAEAATELASLDHLWDMAKKAEKGITKGFLKNLVAQSTIEGSEEGASDLLNRLSDWLILGKDGKNAMTVSIQGYMDQGYSKEEAEKLAHRDFRNEFMQDTAAGFLSGLFMGAIPTAFGFANANKIGKQAKAISENYTELAKNETNEETKALYEGYATNPYSRMAEQVDSSNVVGEESKKQISEVADKVSSGEKPTMYEKAEIAKSMDDARVVSDYLGKGTAESEQSVVPEEYRSEITDITENEARKALAKAARAGDTTAMVETYQQMANSKNASVRNAADEIYQDYLGMAEAHGANAEELRSGKQSTQSAYLAGLSGDENFQATNDQTQQAYNDGKIQAIQNRNSETIESAADMKAAEFATADGKTASVAEFAEDGKVVLSDGRTVDSGDIEWGSGAIGRAYSFAAGMNATVEAKNVYLSNITDGTDIATYNKAWSRFFKAGVINSGFESEMKISKLYASMVGEDVARAMYQAGFSQQVSEYDKEIVKAGRAAFGKNYKSGTFVDNRTKASNDNLALMMRVSAKVLGTNVELVDTLGLTPDGRMKLASFNTATNTIQVTEQNAKQYFHEVGEFMQAFSPNEYEQLRKSLIGATRETLGADTFDAYNALYVNAYRFQGQSERDVTAEMTNDLLVSMMATNKGRTALAKFLVENTSAEEAATISGKIKNFYQKLTGALKSMVKAEDLHGFQREMLDRGYDRLEENVDLFIDTLERAIENRRAEEFRGEEEVSNNGDRLSVETYQSGGRAMLYEYLRDEVKNNQITEKDMNDILDYLDWAYDFAKEMMDKKELTSFGRWSRTGLAVSADGIPFIEIFGPDGKPVQSVAVNNGEYPLNIDVTQVCKKRIALNNVLNRLMSDESFDVTTLSEPDINAINMLIKRYGFEIACGLCFVDSKRYKIGDWSSTFTDGKFSKKTGKKTQRGWNDLVRTMLPKGVSASYFNFASFNPNPVGTLLEDIPEEQLNFKELDKIIGKHGVYDENGNLVGLQGYKDSSGKQVNPKELTRMAYALRTNPDLRHFLSNDDIIASEGLDAVRRSQSELYRLINAHWGAGKPKLSHGFTPYGNEIIRSQKWGSANNFSRENAIYVGGVRVQSFSDYVANMFFDYMQIFADLSARQLPSHAYTKELYYVKLFGMTGQKINMSCVPKACEITAEQQARFDKLLNKGKKYLEADPEYQEIASHAGLKKNADGSYSYIWEDETFPWDEAVKIQQDSRYNQNCGIIVVGVSDEHIRMLLDDENVPMVIPYHASSASNYIRKARNTAFYQDYTRQQRTRYQSSGKGIPANQDFDWYKSLEKTQDARKSAEEYKQFCKDKGYIPVFEQFADHPNYYKLLVDFRMYDYNGMDQSVARTSQMQGNVQMIFPEDFKDIVKQSLYEQQEVESAMEEQLTGDQGTLYDEVKKYLMDQGHGEVKYSISPSIVERLNDESYINRNIKLVAEMDAAVVVSGADGILSSDAKDGLAKRYSEIEKSYNEDVGEIVVSTASARSVISHNINRTKLIASYYIDDILKKGRVIYFDDKGLRSTEYDTAVIAAPIRVLDGRFPGEYLIGAKIVVNKEYNMFVLTEVVEIETDNALSLQTGYYEKDSFTRDKRYPSIIKILQNVLYVKYNGSSFSIQVDNAGYHAGDLGKSESLAMQSGGRDTGHFGTGTYFVGDEALIGDGTGYGNRPHYTVDFSKYNLFRPKTSKDGKELHEFLKGINEFYDLGERTARSEKEWMDRRSYLEDQIESEEIPAGVAIEEAKQLFGYSEVYKYIGRELGESGRFYFSEDGIYDSEKDTDLSDDEVISMLGDEAVFDAIYNALYYNRYAPRFIDQVEEFDSNIEKVVNHLFGITAGEAQQIISSIRDEIANAAYSYEQTKTADSASTRFMKRLGYEGVDVRGIDGLDNTTYGSVIYDLKGEDHERKVANGARYSIQVDSTGTELTEGQQKYFDGSKMVDEKGRLKVMYHGTSNAGFTVFSPAFSDDGISLFFTDDKDVGYSYSGTNMIYSPDEIVSYETLAERIDGYSMGDISLERSGDGFDVVEMGFIDDTTTRFDTLEEVQEWFANYISESEIYDDSDGGIYPVYLNLQNPLIVECDEREWNDLGGLSENVAKQIEYATLYSQAGDDLWEVEFSEWGDLKTETFTTDELEAYFGEDAAKLIINGDEVDDLYLDKNGKPVPSTTREYAEYAKENGYDGVIFKNIVDIGMYGVENEMHDGVSTVAVAFNSEQVKSINNQNPTTLADIRYAVDVDGFMIPEDDFDFDSFGTGSVEDKATISIIQEGMKALAGKTVDEKRVKAVASTIKSEYGSSYSLKKLTDNLTKVFAYLQSEEHVNYDDVMSILDEIAEPVIEKAEQLEGKEVYDDFVRTMQGYNLKLTNQQMKEVTNTFGSFASFRRAMMPLNISTKGTITLESAWAEIADKTMGLLEYDTVEGDMPMALYDALTALRPTLQNTYGGDAHSVARDLSIRILEEYFNAETDAKVAQVEKDAAAKLREKSKAAKEKLEQKYKDKLKEARADLRQKNIDKDQKYRDKVAEIRARNKEKAQKSKERQEVAKQKKYIQKKAAEMLKWIAKPTEEHHVPTQMQSAVLEMLKGFDFVEPDVKQRQKDGKWYVDVYLGFTESNGKRELHFNRVEADSREEAIRRYMAQVGAGAGSKNTKTWIDRMNLISDLYNQAYNGENLDDVTSLLDPTLAAQITALRGTQKAINQLNSSELKVINNIFTNLMKAIRDANTSYTTRSAIKDLGAQMIQLASERKDPSPQTRLQSNTTKTLLLDMATPETFFTMLGKPGQEIYKALREGLNTKIRDIKAASEYTEELMKGVSQKEVRKWTGDGADIHHFDLADGSVEFTTAQIMSLYELSKRQQAMMHMIGGVKADSIKRSNGKVQTQQKGVHITPSELQSIVDTLTDDQKRIADGMQQYLATECARLGNEATELMYGYQKFTDPNYFPISVDKNTVNSNTENTARETMNGIERSGFTKNVTDYAGNTIIVRDIFQVYTDHIVDMAAYHGFAPAIKDANRWFNYRETTEADENGWKYTDSVKGAIDRKLGRVDGAGQQYFIQLIKDLNGQEKSSYISGLLGGLMGNYKAAAVAGNLRVVIQQPTAVVRALNVIDGKYLAKAQKTLAHVVRESKRANEASPIAYWKSKGYYETSLGQSMQEIITGVNSRMDQVRNATMALAGWADDMTWAVLYNAVELEQKDVLKDVSEEEFRKAVNERFDELIDQTQVVDSTLHRSQYMRGQDMLNKMQTAFMAEPIKSYNMMMRAAYLDAQDPKATKFKRTAKALTVMMVTDAVTAAAQTMIDVLRYHEDDDDWWDLIQEKYIDNVKGNINPFARVPGLKDFTDQVAKALAGDTKSSGGNARMDLASVSSLLEAVAYTVKGIQGEGTLTAFGYGMKWAKPLSQLTGIPVYNISRDLTAVYNAFVDENYRLKQKLDTGSIYSSVFNAIDKGKGYDEAVEKVLAKGGSIKDMKGKISGKFKKDYQEAFAQGGEEAVQDLKDRITAAYQAMEMSDAEIADIFADWEGVNDKVSMDNIYDAIMAGEDITALVEEMEENGTKKETIMNRIIEKFAMDINYARKHDSDPLVENAVVAGLKQLDPEITWDKAVQNKAEKAQENAEKNESSSKKKEIKKAMFSAIDSGSGYEKHIDDLLETGMDYGDVKSAITTKYKPLCVEAYKANRLSEAKAIMDKAARASCYIDSKKDGGDPKNYWEKEKKRVEKWTEEDDDE